MASKRGLNGEGWGGGGVLNRAVTVIQLLKGLLFLPLLFGLLTSEFDKKKELIFEKASSILILETWGFNSAQCACFIEV